MAKLVLPQALGRLPAISKAQASRDLVTVPAFDGAEAYAYPKPGSRIGWGINAAPTGVNVLRGIRRSDGVDEAVDYRPGIIISRIDFQISIPRLDERSRCTQAKPGGAA